MSSISSVEALVKKISNGNFKTINEFIEEVTSGGWTETKSKVDVSGVTMTPNAKDKCDLTTIKIFTKSENGYVYELKIHEEQISPNTYRKAAGVFWTYQLARKREQITSQDIQRMQVAKGSFERILNNKKGHGNIRSPERKYFQQIYLWYRTGILYHDSQKNRKINLSLYNQLSFLTAKDSINKFLSGNIKTVSMDDKSWSLTKWLSILEFEVMLKDIVQSSMSVEGFENFFNIYRMSEKNLLPDPKNAMRDTEEKNREFLKNEVRKPEEYQDFMRAYGDLKLACSVLSVEYYTMDGWQYRRTDDKVHMPIFFDYVSEMLMRELYGFTENIDSEVLKHKHENVDSVLLKDRYERTTSYLGMIIPPLSFKNVGNASKKRLQIVKGFNRMGMIKLLFPNEALPSFDYTSLIDYSFIANMGEEIRKYGTASELILDMLEVQELREIYYTICGIMAYRRFSEPTKLEIDVLRSFNGEELELIKKIIDRSDWEEAIKVAFLRASINSQITPSVPQITLSVSAQAPNVKKKKIHFSEINNITREISIDDMKRNLSARIEANNTLKNKNGGSDEPARN